eukprot:1155374-Pelagomonas_calceolata.AAC.1
MEVTCKVWMESSTPHTLWSRLKSLVLTLTRPPSLLESFMLILSSYYAYKVASTRRALEKTSFNSHQQDQARAIASNPPDPH